MMDKNIENKIKQALKNPFLWALVIIFVLSNPKTLPILLIIYIIYSIYKKNMSQDNIIDVNLQKSKKYIWLAIIIILGIVIISQMIIIIPAGSTGVYHLFGKVRDNEIHSGIHLVNPLAQITKMSIRTEEYTMSIAQGEGQKFGNDAIDSLTKEGLTVALDMTVLYHLTEEKASDVYKNVGENYKEKIIRPQIRTAIREIVALYEAKDIYSEKRQEVQQKIHDNLVSNVEPRGITIESVLLRNVALPDKLTNSIQEKLTAEQESQKYDFLLQKEEKEAERKRVEAGGQRDSQKIINESLTDKYLYYLYINQLKDRQGTIYVPTSPTTGMPIFKDIGK